MDELEKGLDEEQKANGKGSVAVTDVGSLQDDYAGWWDAFFFFKLWLHKDLFRYN